MCISAVSTLCFLSLDCTMSMALLLPTSVVMLITPILALALATMAIDLVLAIASQIGLRSSSGCRLGSSSGSGLVIYSSSTKVGFLSFSLRLSKCVSILCFHEFILLGYVNIFL